MSISSIYIKSAIETLELVQQLVAHPEGLNFLAEIETKANARIQSSLAQTLGVNIPVADQEGKPADYWKGVRDMAKLAAKQWKTNPASIIQFLTNTRASLSARITPEETAISPLEEMLQTGAPVVSAAEPSSPLEDILVTPAPTPQPVAPTPTPQPVAPAPRPKPVAPTPKPEPFIPTPKPEPVAPTPKPEPVAPTPKPEPVAPITPKVPDYPEPTIPSPPDKLQALGEALKESGLEQPPSQPSDAFTPSASSLTDMLLSKDETGTDDSEDDMLSLSLREALKILRDEDAD